MGGARPAQPASQIPAGAVDALARLVNAHRRALGCDSLAWDADLGGVAAAHSRAMRELGFFDHIDPQGRDAFARVRAAGITGWRQVAENLALTPRDPPDILRMWLNSPGHRANLENCALDRHGIAVEDGYWTHLFTG
ncbi:MAG TPA: CAP domain-containing protein [Longimicrobiales bacterium]|nr:CAP domain-containing protein [Longimicrobiales bacterium]